MSTTTRPDGPRFLEAATRSVAFEEVGRVRGSGRIGLVVLMGRIVDLHDRAFVINLGSVIIVGSVTNVINVINVGSVTNVGSVINVGSVNGVDHLFSVLVLRASVRVCFPRVRGTGTLLGQCGVAGLGAGKEVLDARGGLR